MKKRFFLLAQVVLLVVLSSGCSDDATLSSDTANGLLGADPTSTILEIFGEKDRFVRTTKLISALRAVPADQVAVFSEVLDGIKFPNRELERVLVVTAWAKHDPRLATKWALIYERVEVVKSAMFAEAVYVWALEDRESLFSDMKMAVYMKGGIEQSMLRALVRGWFDSGEPRLEMWIRNMTAQTIDRQRAVDTLIRLRIERDGAAATIEWAKALAGDINFKKSVYSRVAGQVVVIDSQLAVNWCAEVCDSPIGEGMPPMMARRWAEKSGEEAMDFISSRPDVVGTQIGVRSAYRQFVINDPDGAEAWIENTTEEQRRGSVLQGPVGMHMNMLSATGRQLLAMKWLEYIVDEKERESRLFPVISRWFNHDPAAAEAWMAQSSMSEEAKDRAHNSRHRQRSKVPVR